MQKKISMDFHIGFVIAGLVVGFVVGMTGVGGGSLMAPILLWFGIPPTTAVGTDLLYAAFTKMGGIFVHNKKSNIKREFRFIFRSFKMYLLNI